MSFIKAALADQYSKKLFNGGRGPKSFRLAGYKHHYSNMCCGDFKNFSGREVANITRENPDGRGTYIAWDGHHNYTGMMLV